MATLAALEERVKALEDQLAGSKAESSTPPGGLKVLPSGLVVYEFEGHLIATGLDLPDSATVIGESNSRVSWLRNALQQSYVYGANDAAFEYLFLKANAAGGRPGGSVNLRASDTASNGATFIIQAHPTEHGKVQVQLEDSTLGFISAVLFQGNRFSSWPMKWKPGGFEGPIAELDTTTGPRINYGGVTLRYGPGATQSEVKTIEHGLGRTPSIILTGVENEEGSRLTTVKAINRGAVTFQVQGNATAGFGGEAIFEYSWLAIG